MLRTPILMMLGPNKNVMRYISPLSFARGGGIMLQQFVPTLTPTSEYAGTSWNRARSLDWRRDNRIRAAGASAQSTHCADCISLDPAIIAGRADPVFGGDTGIILCAARAGPRAAHL